MSAATARDGRRVSVALAIVLATALTLLVLVVLLPNLWYRFYASPAAPLYHGYAARIAAGERPYSNTLQIEYPPLAVPIFRLPGHLDDVTAYTHWFTIDMGIVTLLAAAVTALVACRLWPRGGRAYLASVLFPVGVALTGAIILNRYDVVVALVLALFLLCLAGRWYTAAAFVLGTGFALKLTPAALLPLVLVLVGPVRRWAWPLVAFAAAAVAPFLPYLLTSGRGVWYVFRYHLERPLQIESVLGTPILFGQLVGLDWAGTGWSHGSHYLTAPGVGLAANLSGGLTLVAVAVVYALVWRRRARLRAALPDQTLAVLALVLALMAFSKVLSPQFFIWALPPLALVAARDRLLAALGGLTLLLTHVEFPALYSALVLMRPWALAIVVVRNCLLLALFAATLWRLWQLPEDAAATVEAGAAPAEVGRPPATPAAPGRATTVVAAPDGVRDPSPGPTARL